MAREGRKFLKLKRKLANDSSGGKVSFRDEGASGKVSPKGHGRSFRKKKKMCPLVRVKMFLRELPECRRSSLRSKTTPDPE